MTWYKATARLYCLCVYLNSSLPPGDGDLGRLGPLHLPHLVLVVDDLDQDQPDPPNDACSDLGYYRVVNPNMGISVGSRSSFLTLEFGSDKQPDPVFGRTWIRLFEAQNFQFILHTYIHFTVR